MSTQTQRPHVVVTGASSGIGEAVAREYLKRGAVVSLVARRADRLQGIASMAPDRARVIEADLSEPSRAAEFLERAVQASGPVDVLVNNAGQQIVGPTTSIDPAKGEALLALDLLTPLRLTQAVLPGMLSRGRGTVIDIASMAAITPTPGMLHYNAAKAGLAAASESLREELRGTGVHVLTVYPGPVDTVMARDAIARTGGSKLAAMLPVGQSDELARLIRLAAEQRKARLIYPRSYAITWYTQAMSRWFTGRFSPRFTAG